MTYVICHDGPNVNECIKRHTPFWLKHGTSINFVSPADCYLQGHKVYGTPKDPKAVGEIIKYILQDFISSRCQEAYVYEYDSFCLQPNTDPLDNGLHGNVRSNSDHRFEAMRYAMAPWAFNRFTALSIMQSVQKWPNIGYWVLDRNISSWATLAGVPIISWDLTGYTDNTLTLDDIALATRIKPFPIWWHGVKTQTVFDAILNSWVL